jgi:glutathione S-transferase
MAELQIIGGPASNFVWVCRVACVEKGVPYSLVPVMPHTPEVDAIHPFGKIPAMRHGDVTLCESRAICSYIDRAFDGPPLVPADPVGAARCEQWISIACTTIDPVMLRQYFAAYIFPGTPDGSPNRPAIDAALPKMEAQFAVLDHAVAKTGHLVGDRFTLADTYLLPILYYMSKRPESSAMLGKAAHLQSYLDRHLDRRSVKETTPAAMPGRR